MILPASTEEGKLLKKRCAPPPVGSGLELGQAAQEAVRPTLTSDLNPNHNHNPDPYPQPQP